MADRKAFRPELTRDETIKMTYSILHCIQLTSGKYNLVSILLVLEVSAKKTIDKIVFLYICHYGRSVWTWCIYTYSTVVWYWQLLQVTVAESRKQIISHRCYSFVWTPAPCLWKPGSPCSPFLPAGQVPLLTGCCHPGLRSGPVPRRAGAQQVAGLAQSPAAAVAEGCKCQHWQMAWVTPVPREVTPAPGKMPGWTCQSCYPPSPHCPPRLPLVGNSQMTARATWATWRGRECSRHWPDGCKYTSGDSIHDTDHNLLIGQKDRCCNEAAYPP